MQPMKQCNFPMCRERIPLRTRYCDRHLRQTRQEYDSNHRDRSAKKFYASARWQKFRRWYLAEFPLCHTCGAVAQHLHHVVPMKQGGGEVDPENVRGLCVRCHSRESVLSGERFGRRRW